MILGSLGSLRLPSRTELYTNIRDTTALSRLARCAGKRSRVSSAPRPFGFEPVPRQQKSDQPESIAFYSMVGRQGFSLLRRRPLRRFRALRAALANAHAFTQLRALSGSNPCRGNKKAAGIRQSLFYSMVGRQGFEPWTLGLKVPCSAS